MLRRLARCATTRSRSSGWIWLAQSSVASAIARRFTPGQRARGRRRRSAGAAALSSTSASNNAIGSASRIAACRARLCSSSRSIAQPLDLGAEIGFAQLLLGAALGLDLPAHDVQVDEHATFDLQHDRIDRLEHIIDRAHRVAAHQVLGLLVDRRQEDDRDARGLRALADQLGGFVAVHPGMNTSSRMTAKSSLSSARSASRPDVDADHFGQRLEHLGQRQQVALVVVDHQDARCAGFGSDAGVRRFRVMLQHDRSGRLRRGALRPRRLGALFERPIHTRISASNRSMSTGLEI